MKFSVERLEKFLERLANLPDDVAGSRDLLKAYPSFLPPIPLGTIRLWFCCCADNALPEAREWSDYSETELFHEYWLKPLRNKLRSVWANPHRSWSEWVIFKVCEYVVFGEPTGQFPAPFSIDVPKVPVESTAVEEALQHLRRNLHRTRICANRQCQTPYFFAKRSSTKFCSEVCATPTQRAAKRKWWRTHGEEWITKRRRDLGNGRGN